MERELQHIHLGWEMRCIGVTGCHHTPHAPQGPHLLGCNWPWQGSLLNRINSLRCSIKCFNKSLIYHTSCVLSINSFSNFTQKKTIKSDWADLFCVSSEQIFIAPRSSALKVLRSIFLLIFVLLFY